MGSSAATRNNHLSNYAFGIAQDLTSALARFFSPLVATGTSSGQYKKFDDKNAFQVYDTLRAIGGENRLIEFAASDPHFNCQPRGLAIGIDDAERNKAGPEGQTQLEEAKVKTLVSTTVLSDEKTVFDAVLNGVSPAAGKGNWSSDDVDPVDEIDALIEKIATATGLMPNRAVFGLGAWRVFRNHPKVKARQPGATLIGVTTQDAARMVLNPGIDIRVGLLSRDTKKFGAAANKVNLIGGQVVLFYNQDNP
ncbi:major capsid protein, partial [Prosthecobacter sp.]|uniref:major capsid protein n=1 Tax=Prosthecobacter sp. TaxID=1965333 RepID=UPI0037843664